MMMTGSAHSHRSPAKQASLIPAKSVNGPFHNHTLSIMIEVERALRIVNSAHR